MIVRSLDPAGDIIIVKASGLWTEAEVTEHYEELRRMIARVRASGKPIRILSDVRAADRQTAGAENVAAEEMKRTFSVGDRIALLVASESDQIHVRQQLSGPQFAVFKSRIAAEIWLSYNGGK